MHNDAICTAVQLAVIHSPNSSPFFLFTRKSEHNVAWAHCAHLGFGRRALPSSLLLLSRAFTVTQPLSKGKGESEYDSLKDTLSSLPKEVVDEIAMSSPADG